MRERLHAQLLTGPRERQPEQVVDRLLAVQAQDERGARLAIRSRSAGLTAADVDAALTDRRSLVITWLNRGTLHLVAAEDYWWLHPITTPQLAAGNARRLGQEGVTPQQADRGVEVVAAAVATDGPQTRAQLRARLDRARVPTGGQALVHVLLAASIRGHVVRGPLVGGHHAYVSVLDWLGPRPKPLGEATALEQLARRYLAGHGPAEAADLARWAGITLGKARSALRAIDDELTVRGDGLVDLAGRPRPPRSAPPRLLGAFDPLLLGWASREPIVGPHRAIVTTNGIFRPFALVGGRAVATWGLRAGTLKIAALEGITAPGRRALQADSRDVLRFLGLPPRPPVWE